MLRAIEKSRVSQGIVDQLVSLIRSGNFTPGDQLPGERQMAQKLGVSRNSVREALRTLETVGLIEIKPGKGTFVKDPSSEVLRAALVPHLFQDEDTFAKLFELREIIEVEAASRAAERISEEQLEQIGRWLNTMEVSVDNNDLEMALVADVEFHRHVIIATGNDVLIDLMESVVDLLREMRRISPSFVDLLPHSIKQHRAILAALKRGDGPAAKEAMHTHLQDVRADSKFIPEKEERPPSKNSDGAPSSVET